MDDTASCNGDEAPEHELNDMFLGAPLKKIRHVLLGSIQRVLIILLLVVIIPGLLYKATENYNSIETQRNHEFQSNLELARSVADTFDAFIQDILHEELAVGLDISSRDFIRVNETNQELLAIAKEYPSIRHLTWTDPQGRVVTSSQPERVGADYSHYSFVQGIVNGRDWLVSDIFLGESSNNPAVVIARGIRNDRGSLRGIVLTAVDPNLLGSVFNVKRTGQGAISIFDRQGMFVYRIPEVAMTWEQRQAGQRQTSVVEALSGKELNATVLSVIENRKRMASYTPIRSIGWIASTSRPEEEVMGPIVQGTIADFGILFLAVILAFVAALLIGSFLTVPIWQLREYALAVGRGELGHRVAVNGPAELEQLARTFNRMSAEIKIREDKLQKAHDELETRVEKRTAELSKANKQLHLAIAERTQAETSLKLSFERLQRALEGTIKSLAMAAEVKDPYTAGHQERVTRLACAIANEMALPEAQVEGIRLAATVHDIGKIAIPSEILCKPGRLSEIEFHLIQAHSQVAYDILKTIEFPWPIAQIVLQHHERIDGSGYPQGLKGEEILLEARVLALADVTEAIASFRPYRPSLGIETSLNEISQDRGILYDPQVVDACLTLFREKGFTLDQETTLNALPAAQLANQLS